jgi:diguanylate cyclase (GGDEF)-like protein
MVKKTPKEETTRPPGTPWIHGKYGENGLEACLIMIRGPQVGRRVVLDKDEIILGRSKSADVQIDESCISRRHAVIKRQASNFIIMDQNSTNGTFVNTERRVACVLRDQDLIMIGNTVFKFIANDSPELPYHEELHKLASLDPALQIHNKRFFLEYLEQKCHRSQLLPTRLAIILFDIDHFKHINDTYGHQAGDQVLLHVANIVKSRLRNSDIFSRYGGEEFAVALPDSDAEQAGMTAEKLRRVVEAAAIIYDEDEIRVTISLGAASFEPAEAAIRSSRDLIERADSALYQAKKAGRNRAVVYRGPG